MSGWFSRPNWAVCHPWCCSPIHSVFMTSKPMCDHIHLMSCHVPRYTCTIFSTHFNWLIGRWSLGRRSSWGFLSRLSFTQGHVPIYVYIPTCMMMITTNKERGGGGMRPGFFIAKEWPSLGHSEIKAKFEDYGFCGLMAWHTTGWPDQPYTTPVRSGSSLYLMSWNEHALVVVVLVSMNLICSRAWYTSFGLMRVYSHSMATYSRVIY